MPYALNFEVHYFLIGELAIYIALILANQYILGKCGDLSRYQTSTRLHCADIKLDQFEAYVKDIIEGNTEISSSGVIKYAKDGLCMNKRMLIVIDETQDLSEDYSRALLRINRGTYADLYIVGDKMQSITYDNNAFTYFYNQGYPIIKGIEIVLHKPSNTVRRFNNQYLCDFVNHMVPFQSFNCPMITPGPDAYMDSDGVEFIEGEPYRETDDPSKLASDVQILMDKYIEVINAGYAAKDILIVSPVVRSGINTILEHFRHAITNWWNLQPASNAKTEASPYYAYIHRSEEHCAIDLSLSENCTRIVSIHAAKGDGRSVVFVIGLNQAVLECYRTISGRLRYESLFHVSITRQKRKLFFRVETNGDDIHQRVQKFLLLKNVHDFMIKPTPLIQTNLTLESLVNSDLRSENYELIRDTLSNIEELDFAETSAKTIDMKHHMTRRRIMKLLFILEIVAYENKLVKEAIEKSEKSTDDNKVLHIRRQLLCRLENTNGRVLQKMDTFREYYKFLSAGKKDKRGIWQYTYDMILPYMNLGNSFKEFAMHERRVKQILNGIGKQISAPRIDVMESIALAFMLETGEMRSFSEFPIGDLYDILYLYSKKDASEKEQTIKEHYDMLMIVKNLYTTLANSKYKHLNWLMNHPVMLESNSDDINVRKKFELIAYNDTHLIILILRPQVNDLNIEDIKMQALFDTYLLSNICQKTENYDRFKDKKIVHMILSLDQVPIEFSISLNESNQKDMTQVIYQNMHDYYEKYSCILFQLFRYFLNKYENDSTRMLKEIIDTLNKTNTPIFIIDFFKSIGTLIEEAYEDDDLAKVDQIIINFGTSEYFTRRYMKKLKTTLNKFIKI